MAFLSADQLAALGLGRVGRDVRISDRASLHNPGQIEIGDATRIDDFVVVSAGREGIRIGRNVHVACFCSIIGAAAIRIEDFANLSSRVALYSSTDDFSGFAMTNPTVPARYTNVTSAPVTVGRHVVIGSGSVVLPGVNLARGVAVGALSLVKEDCAEFRIYAGVPARVVGERSRRLLELERELLGP